MSGSSCRTWIVPFTGAATMLLGPAAALIHLPISMLPERSAQTRPAS
jgi:hypothetical protein